jgi:hypothetical protein
MLSAGGTAGRLFSCLIPTFKGRPFPRSNVIQAAFTLVPPYCNPSFVRVACYMARVRDRPEIGGFRNLART